MDCLIYEICQKKNEFISDIDKRDIRSVMCLQPNMNNPRIISQDGHFFVFGIDHEKEKHAKLNPD